jgi:superfamily II DNA helicase RecQ
VEAEHVSIFLYMSSKSLQPNLFWHKVLHESALKSMISLMCIVEAHTVAQDGRNFWPEFHTAVKTLRELYKTQTMKCFCIAMSATFRQSDQDVISKLFGKKPDMLIWLELSRRCIHFDVVITGNPIISMTSALNQDYKYATTMKSIVYSNSKRQAVGTIAKSM